MTSHNPNLSQPTSSQSESKNHQSHVIMASLFLPLMPSFAPNEVASRYAESPSKPNEARFTSRSPSPAKRDGTVSFIEKFLKKKRSVPGTGSARLSAFFKSNTDTTVSEDGDTRVSDVASTNSEAVKGRPVVDVNIKRLKDINEPGSPIMHSPASNVSPNVNWPLDTQANKSQTWRIVPSPHGNIGLQNSLNSVNSFELRRTWVGTVGCVLDDIPPATQSQIRQELRKRDCVDVALSFSEFYDGYHGFCKQLLWPLFHSQIPRYHTKHTVTTKNHGHKVISRHEFEQRSWKAYKSMNEKFADAICAIYKEGDVIWVNDYHLMLLPSILRKRLPNAIIGFFLHVPFPSSEIMRCLYVRKEILEGVLGADLCGFQTYSFARHFLQTSSRILALETTPKFLQLENTVVSVGIFPIGINTTQLTQKLSDPAVSKIATALEEKYAGKKVIVGRDKLDHVKGVRHKMLAYEMFLEKNPEWVGKVVLIQVALSTSEANEVQGEVSDIVSRINSIYGSLEYSPVVYLRKDISFTQYIALLSIADACLITSLRDGMNLTSHEYIVCQQRKMSPLILSEFTGSYGSFGAAVRVNPMDYGEVASAILEVLTMGEEERVARWQELYKTVTNNSAQHFVNSFVSELLTSSVDMQRRFSIAHPHLLPLLPQLTSQYRSAKKRLILLDYDGTLLPYEKSPSIKGAVERLDRIAELLKRLIRNGDVVYIISGRRKESLEDRLGKIEGLGISAETGCFVRDEESNYEWVNLFEHMDTSWKSKVSEIFEYYTERTPGSFIEMKNVSMVWHYRLTDTLFGAWQARECQNHIEDSIGSVYPIHAIPGKKNIEVLPREINKSVIIKRVLERHPDIDFVLAIGDDRADEEMFEYLDKLRSSQEELEESDEPLGVVVGDGAEAVLKMDVAKQLLGAGKGVSALKPRKRTFSASASIPSSNLNNTAPTPVNGQSTSSQASEVKSSQPQVPVSPTKSIGPKSEQYRNIITCTVGSKASGALYFLTGVDEVLLLLSSLPPLPPISGSTASSTTSTLPVPFHHQRSFSSSILDTYASERDRQPNNVSVEILNERDRVARIQDQVSKGYGVDSLTTDERIGEGLRLEESRRRKLTRSISNIPISNIDDMDGGMDGIVNVPDLTEIAANQKEQ
ncbi:glycosyltransferase family 20-domain-containing protein [Paraphysoderma sedebokerense]|nr:glycosyltransferase family 20-domain-containing protein [Paraphysoderma sedebokerense]